MVKHPNNIVGYKGSIDDLVKSVGNMQYNKTAKFIELLADDLIRQADNDLAKGRKKLASELYATASKLYEAEELMYGTWKTCEPYMKNK